MRSSRGRDRCRSATAASLIAAALTLSSCSGETFQRGYVLPEGALEQIPLGASQEQVLLGAGSASTVATVSGEVLRSHFRQSERRNLDVNRRN